MELFSNRTKGLHVVAVATAYKYIHTHNSVLAIVGERKCTEQGIDLRRLHVESLKASQQLYFTYLMSGLLVNINKYARLLVINNTRDRQIRIWLIGGLTDYFTC